MKHHQIVRSSFFRTFGGIVLLVPLIGILLWVGQRGVPSSRESSSENPKASLDKTDVNLGALSVHQDGKAIFTLSNTGKAPLLISNISTTCNCLSVNITIGQTTVGKFTHPTYTKTALKDWSGTIPPGEHATLTAFFTPSDYVVYGLVLRQIRFNTNDPELPAPELTVFANVLKD